MIDCPCVSCLVTSVVGLVVAYLASQLFRKKVVLSGQHVVITGGSQGIGKEVALEAVKKGAKVTLIARRENILKDTQKQIQAQFPDSVVHICALDLTSSYEAVEKGFSTLCEQMGQEVDVLVNCAGTSQPGEFDSLPIEVFERQMRINYYGSVYATRAVVKSMKAREHGAIVFVSSQAGQCGIYGFAAYSPTKFALVGLSQSLSMELKPYRIHVMTCYPPDTDTPGFAEENLHKPEATRKISETSGLFKPSQVASLLVRDLEQGRVASVCGVDGWMLGILTAGMGPCSGILDGLQQALLMPVFRIISLFYLKSFDDIALKEKQRQCCQK